MSEFPERWHQAHERVIGVFNDFREELMVSYGDVAHTRKIDSSQVTELDVRVEKTLKSVLNDEFPEFGFQGEETGASGSRDAYWLVDPIDGTTSFIRGIDRCTNMAALVADGEPVMSVVYDFPKNALYTAIKGRGAFCNNQPIRVSDRAIDDAFLDNASSRMYAGMYPAVRRQGMRLHQPLGAAGRSLVDVASGRSEGYIVYGAKLGLHDLLPGLLIAKEAGAEVVSFDGNDAWDMHSPGNYGVFSPKVAQFFKNNPDIFG